MGRDRERDELNFHFHLERELIDLTSTFRFHVHFSDSQSPERAGVSQLQATPRRFYYGITLPIPSAANNARVTASGAFICGYGHADFSGFPPDEVYGKVYDPDDIVVCDAFHPSTKIPATPPEDAVQGQLINFGTHPIFPECDEPFLCNYAFHCLYDNELPVALHSEAGSENCLVVWSRRGGSGSYKRDTVSFLAVSSMETECNPCDDAGSTSLKRSAQFAPDLVPAELTVAVDVEAKHLKLPQLERKALKELLPAEGIRLTYDPHHPEAGSPEWKTSGCTKKNGDWRLRLTRLGTDCIGTLSLHAIGGLTLTPPLEWQARGWQPGRPAEFVAYRPAELVQARSTLRVQPR